MQSSSCLLLCSSNFQFPSLPYPASHRFAFLFSHQSINCPKISSFPAKFPFNSVDNPLPSHFSLHRAATEEVYKTSQIESEFVDVGYICRVHGLQGEVRVKPSTDFPELRFAKPGRRWLRQQIYGREMIQEVQLVEGRGHSGQQGWIVRFNEVDTVDEALKLVGSTILVSEQDRPELEEGEFYTHDLVGMRVILKDTGQLVGTVVSIFNGGASDLLHVELNSSVDKSNQTGNPKQRVGDSGPLVWIPFVEAIVPDVDMNKREILITPPKGLLDLNIRSDERSKKERRQLEWKERKKFEKRVIAAKNKLCELEQQHVFDGFRHGGKSQARLLAEEIVTVNTKLLQQAVQSIHIHTSSDIQMRNALEVPEKSDHTRIKQQSDLYSKLQEKGFFLTSHGKVATILVLEDTEEPGQSSESGRNGKIDSLLEEALLLENESLVKTEIRPSMPLIFICPAPTVASLEELFLNHNHFSFDSNKVWFLEEEKLPVVSNSLEEPQRHKILMKSPWEILQRPVGSGGVISLLSSNKLLDNLSTFGVEYVEVCKNRFRGSNGDALIGLIDSFKANVGLEVFKDVEQPEEENLHMIFSIKFMKKLAKQIDRMHFEAIPMANRYTEKVEKDWVDVIPSSPTNSLEFHCSLYSFLDSWPSDEICILEVSS